MEKIWVYAFPFLAVILFAFLIVVNRKLALEGLSPFAYATLLPVVLFLLALLVWFFYGNPFGEIKNISVSHWKWIIFAGIINIIAFLIMYVSLEKISATDYNILTLTAPIFAAIFSYALLKETITWHLFVGLIFIAIGLYISLFKPSIL